MELGVFDKNMLTFNPGWDTNAQKLAAFTDPRKLRRQLKAQGVRMVQEGFSSISTPEWRSTAFMQPLSGPGLCPRRQK